MHDDASAAGSDSSGHLSPHIALHMVGEVCRLPVSTHTQVEGGQVRHAPT